MRRTLTPRPRKKPQAFCTLWMVERAYSRGADVRCMVSIVTRDVNALHEPFKPSFALFGITQMGQIFKCVGKLESLRRPTEWAVLGRTNAPSTAWKSSR